MAENLVFGLQVARIGSKIRFLGCHQKSVRATFLIFLHEVTATWTLKISANEFLGVLSFFGQKGPSYIEFLWGFLHEVEFCVCYIFTSLFCISKREVLWNKGKCFLFHFKSSFHSWDFNFSDTQMSWRYQMLKDEIRNTFHWITWEAKTVW